MCSSLSFSSCSNTVLTLAGTSWWPAHPGTLAWTMLAVQALADASLVFRRRAPMLVIAILGGFSLVISLLISPAGLITPENAGTVWAPLGTVLAAYGPFYYRRDRRAAFAAVGTLTLIVARVWEPSASVIAIGVLRTAVGPLLALYFTARHEVLQGLRDRAERAEQERYLLAEQARAEERARLAGEMHDVVTHRVSLMVLQAGALGITAKDEATRQAAEELRAAGCQALDELRDLVGILRTEPDGDQTPSTPGLPALIAESTAAGAVAELTEDGDPALASPVVGRTVYRIVREALTNARKHAPGAHRARPDRLPRVAGQGRRQQRAGHAKRGQRAERHRIRPWPRRPAPAHRADARHVAGRANAGRRVPARGRAAGVRPDG